MSRKLNAKVEVFLKAFLKGEAFYYCGPNGFEDEEVMDFVFSRIKSDENYKKVNVRKGLSERYKKRLYKQLLQGTAIIFNRIGARFECASWNGYFLNTDIDIITEICNETKLRKLFEKAVKDSVEVILEERICPECSQ